MVSLLGSYCRSRTAAASGFISEVLLELQGSMSHAHSFRHNIIGAIFTSFWLPFSWNTLVKGITVAMWTRGKALPSCYQAISSELKLDDGLMQIMPFSS